MKYVDLATSLKDAIMVPGHMMACDHPTEFLRVCIDSRQIMPHDLFVAIVGERVDGHDYIDQAIAKGAVAVVSERIREDLPVPLWVVPDTLKALASIAAEHRLTLTCPMIALTGSNGKTTVKEMIAQILPSPSFATPGNLNNHIGVPLCLLQCQPDHRYAVFELGANHVGEIAYTANLVKPDVALINNIAPAHVEGFGGIEGVVRAKGEIYQALAEGGVAVVNEDDKYAHAWDSLLLNREVVRFSSKQPTMVHAGHIYLNAAGCATFELVTPSGTAKIVLQVPGYHTVQNALAAAACCYALHIPLEQIEHGLNQFSGVPGRMSIRCGVQGICILDDTYNANLSSTLAALEVLAQHDGQRIFVFGDMGELGVWSEEHHKQVGLAARRLGIEVVMSCGIHSAATTKAFGTPSQHYATHALLLEALLPQLNRQTTILVKGSRSARMENIVQSLLDPSNVSSENRRDVCMPQNVEILTVHRS